jgi:hypothetical protein
MLHFIYNRLWLMFLVLAMLQYGLITTVLLYSSIPVAEHMS